MKDYFGYENKVCVVTGASSGMGKATAEMLVDLGAQVYALDVVESTSEGLTKFIQVSLGEKDSIDQAFAQIPEEIDSFFGIAGVAGVRQDYNTTVTVNYIANKYMTETYLLERMKPGGAISFITSTAGWNWENQEYREELEPIIDRNSWEESVAALKAMDQNSKPGGLGYTLSKRALNYYIASIVQDFAAKKVRVNGVLPAATQSGLTDEFAILSGGKENLMKSVGLAGRMAESREMAEPIVFLNSNMASFISGVLLNVDYGQYTQTLLGEIPNMLDFKLLDVQIEI
ncbi:MAG: SDR family oxidoreductase [Lysinibacillus sp.]